MDFLRGRQALYPCCDIHGLAEIILPLVEHDRETRAFVNADLDDQVLGAARQIELCHRRAHTQTRRKGMVGLDEGRHHGVADGFDHRAFFRRDDFQQRLKMRAHQIKRSEIADPLIQRGRALQIGEQEGQRGDLEPLVDTEIVGLVDVAKRLVGQHPLGGEERLPIAQQMMQAVGGNEDRRQHPHIGLVVERKPQRAGAHGRGAGRCVHLVVDQ